MQPCAWPFLNRNDGRGLMQINARKIADHRRRREPKPRKARNDSLNSLVARTQNMSLRVLSFQESEINRKLGGRWPAHRKMATISLLLLPRVTP